MNGHIRRAEPRDCARLAEIEVFSYRLNFYPIFQSDDYYFSELTVAELAEKYRREPELIRRTLVYDDGAVKGFIRINGSEAEKLFVEPALAGRGIGGALFEYAVREAGVRSLWALEKNTRAIAFYARHGFLPTGERKPEEDTEEYLVRLEMA